MFLVPAQAEAAFPLSFIRKLLCRSCEPPRDVPRRDFQIISSWYRAGTLHCGRECPELAQHSGGLCNRRVRLLDVKGPEGSYYSGGRNRLITHRGVGGGGEPHLSS